MAPYKKTKVEPVKYDTEDDDLEGPVVDRSCRDIPCCILFVVFVFGMGIVAISALKQGNPYSLIYGVDSWGNICNDKNPDVDLRGLKKSFHFNAAWHFLEVLAKIKRTRVDGVLNQPFIVVCVRKCPDRNISTPEEAQAFQDEENTNLCLYNISTYNNNPNQCAGLPVIKQTSVLNRCIPSKYIELLTEAVNGYLSSVAEATVGPDFAQNAIQDVETSFREILILCGVAAGSALMMVLLLQFIAAIMIWSIVVLTEASALAAAGYSWYIYYGLYTTYQSVDEALRTPALKEEQRMWLFYSIFATVVSIILLAILIFLRKRIGLVVQLFQEAGSALRRIPTMLLQPVWTLCAIAATVTLTVVIALYVETTGTPSLDDAGFVQYARENEVWNILRWYHYFGALWATAFILACQDMIIAGAVATWYFNRTKRSLGWPLITSTWRLFRFHLGSVAFGSLIIAIVRFVRLVLAYIQRKIKGRTGKVAKFIFAAVQCCLFCFEKFLVYLNRNAYIEIAIYGHSFCTAAKKAFLLIVSNVLRVAAINSVGDFTLFLGKIFPIGIVVITGHLLLKTRVDINMTAVPITVAAAFAFAVAQGFFGVYEIVIDTIFICFCEDCEQNDGVTKPYYMSKGLMSYMNRSEKVELRRKQPVPKDSKEEKSDLNPDKEEKAEENN